MALVDTTGLNQLESVMPTEAWEPLHWLAEGLDYRKCWRSLTITVMSLLIPTTLLRQLREVNVVSMSLK